MKSIFLSVLVVASLCGCKKTSNSPSNLTSDSNSPLNAASNPQSETEAFGWNLGDRLPSEIPVKTNDDFSLSYEFTPERPAPPFTGCFLLLTSDRRVADIMAMGIVTNLDEFEKTRDSLVQVLTKKYGLRHHSSTKDADEYVFGTEERGIELGASYSMGFMITYADKVLQAQISDERKQREEESKYPLTPKENLHPASEAFGWNLGGQLSSGVPIRTNDSDFSLSYDFTPERPVEPFNLYFLSLTSDYKIATIEAFGIVSDSDQPDKIKAPLVELLAEKYGLRHHFRTDNFDEYDFGTEERGINLTISHSTTFELTYFNSALRSQASEENKQRAVAAKNSLKEGFKNSGM